MNEQAKIDEWRKIHADATAEDVESETKNAVIRGALEDTIKFLLSDGQQYYGERYVSYYETKRNEIIEILRFAQEKAV